MCAGTIAYVLYQSSRYLDDGTTGSMSKAGRKSAPAPRVSTARAATANTDEEVEMKGNLLTQEEILSQIEKVREKQRRRRGRDSSDVETESDKANEDEQD